MFALPSIALRNKGLLVAVALALAAALALVLTGTGPAGAQDGSQPPAKPTGLAVATTAGSLDVSLDWDDAADAASYLVRWREYGPEHELNDGITVETSRSTITVVEYGDWVLRVEACNEAGCGPGATTRFQVKPELPARPTGLTVATEAGSLDLSASWDAAQRADTYRLQWRRPDGNIGDNQVTTTGTSGSITVTGYGQWVVRVEGCNYAGCGPGASTTLEVEPASEPEPTPTPEPSVPGQPTGLAVATTAGSLDVSLDWDDADGAASYLVRWREYGPEHELNEGVTVETSQATIAVSHYGDWVLRLEACNDAGCGQHLGRRFQVKPDLPARPTGLTVATEAGSLDLSASWDAAQRADSYKLQWRRPSGGFGDNQVVTTGTSAGITVADYGQWVVRVEGCNYAGCGPGASETLEVEPASEPEPTPEPASEGLAVAIAASPASPATGERVTLTAVIANPPAESQPTYRWEMNDGGWFTVGKAAGFSYMSETPAAWSFRLTVAYGSGESATSEPVAVRWTHPNRAPVVDRQAEGYAGFVNSQSAPPGVQARKSFEGIFSDPDGDELAYSVSVPPDSGMAADVGVHLTEDIVLFRHDGNSDWAAVTPVLPDPLTTTVTLTATDPEGLSASVRGDFHAYWGSHYQRNGVPAGGPAEPASAAPEAPGNLAVEAGPGEWDLTASWEGAEWASIYRVRWRLAGRDFWPADEARVTATETAVSVAGYGRWVVRVEGCNSAGCGPAAVSAQVVQPTIGPARRGQLGDVVAGLSRTEYVPYTPPAREAAHLVVGTQVVNTTSIVYVVDDSASMDADFREVRTSLRTVRGTAMADTKVALVAFGTSAETIFGLTDHSTDATTGPWTDARINSLGGKRGGTNYQAALRMAKGLLDADTAATKKIIFLTDGADTGDDPSAEVAAITAAGIILDTIMFGQVHGVRHFSILTAASGTDARVDKPWLGTTNSPKVATNDLPSILKASVASDTATLFLVDNSMSVASMITMDGAFAAAWDKAAESGVTGESLGLATFVGENPWESTGYDVFGPEYYQKYRQGIAMGAAPPQAGKGNFFAHQDLVLYAGASTDINNALDQAHAAITASGVTQTAKRVVLISDGISAVDVAAATLDKYRASAATRVFLDTVAIGNLADRVLLKQWADASGGSFGVARTDVVAVFDKPRYTVAESDDPLTPNVKENQAVVTVRLGVPAGRELTIPLVAAHRGSTTGADYSGVPAELEFSRGDILKSFTFTATHDGMDDDGDQLVLSLGALPTGVSAGEFDEAAISITDDDVAGSPPSGFQVWWSGGTPTARFGNDNLYRLFLEVSTSAAGPAVKCTVSSSSHTGSVNCPPGTLVSMSTMDHRVLRVGGSGSDRLHPALGTEITIAATATGDDGVTLGHSAPLTAHIGGPNVPKVSVSAGSGRLGLSWDGDVASPTVAGAAVNGFRVRYRENGAAAWSGGAVLSAATKHHTLSGLDSAKSYEILVQARNDAGDASADTNWWGFGNYLYRNENRRVVPNGGAGLPGPISAHSVSKPAAGQLKVAWSAPASDGGAAVHYYTVRHKVATAADSTYVERIVSASEDRDVTITGLTGGTGYTIQIRAHNVNGNSAWTNATGTPD